MDYETFVNDAIENALPEPFCPFCSMYCNDAYSIKCYSCEISEAKYKEKED